MTREAAAPPTRRRRWDPTAGWWSRFLQLLALAVGVLAAGELTFSADGPSYWRNAVLLALVIAALLRWSWTLVWWTTALAVTLSFGSDVHVPVLAVLLVQVFLSVVISDHPPRRGVMTGVLTVLTLYGQSGLAHGWTSPSAGAMVAWTAAVVGVAAAVRWRREYALEVSDRAQQTIRERDVATGRRMAEERLLIARELHDAIGHHLAVVNLHAGLAGRLVHRDPQRAELAIAETRRAAHDALEELGAVLRVLRQPGEAALAGPTPAMTDLPELVDAFTRGGLDVQLTVSGAPGQADTASGLTVYRVVQEALTNAHKHGGGSARVMVRIGESDVTVQVVNPVRPKAAAPSGPVRGHRVGDEPPATAGSHGWGLIGMAERVRAARGELTVIEQPAGAYELHAVIPVRVGGVTSDPSGHVVTAGPSEVGGPAPVIDVPPVGTTRQP